MFRHVALGASSLLPLLASPAMAVSFSSAGSGAYATYVHLTANGVLAADATTAGVSGTALPAYNQAGGVASVNQSFNLATGVLGNANQGLTTGVVTTTASSNAPTSSSATASANLSNVGTNLTNKLVSDLVPTSLLNLTADAISSTTTAGIDAGGNLVGSGSSTLTNFGLLGTALGALNIDGTLYSNPAANTVVLSLANLVVTLNEQIKTQTASTLAFQTNAVHIAFNNYSLAGKLVTGDVILGHSEAQINGAVPEPGTWAMMLVGFGVAGYSLRRRRPLAYA